MKIVCLFFLPIIRLAERRRLPLWMFIYRAEQRVLILLYGHVQNITCLNLAKLFKFLKSVQKSCLCRRYLKAHNYIIFQIH